MASNKKNIQNMDEILEFLLDDNDPDSDLAVDLGDELSNEELDSDWEYETEPQVADTDINNEQPVAGSAEPVDDIPDFEKNDNENSETGEIPENPELSEEEIMFSSSSSSSDVTTDDDLSPPVVKRRVRTRGGHNTPKVLRNNEGQHRRIRVRGGGQAVPRGGGQAVPFCGGRGGRVRGRGQVRGCGQVRGRGNRGRGMPNLNVQPEQWEWDNIEHVDYVEEIDENECFPFNETEGLNVRMRDNATVLDLSNYI